MSESQPVPDQPSPALPTAAELDRLDAELDHVDAVLAQLDQEP